MADGEDQKLSKELKLFDVFAISTGAMFSSGFFLLPGLAAAEAGPSVVLAYLIAGVLMLPAMLSMAELSTAMPRAGGAYYFLDRALGPVVGTVGGVGTWIALILKSAFGLIGMGAYLALFFDVPVTQLALVLTLVFTIVNIVGAKETSQLQRWLVVILLSVLFFFLVQGFVEIVSLGPGVVRESQFSPLMPFGVTGLFSTVGLVFVSYAGLTKVASVAEEIQDPDVNIPLGMTLSLIVATAAYVLGVVVIVAVLEPNALHEDLTPVATAARSFFDWLPGSTGVVLVVAAAIAAFASTANAGIMSASRYLFAMGRDKVVSPGFSRIGRFKTPTRAVWATGVLMALVLVSLDVMSVAKLASAFQLFIFSLLNLAVIVLRESRIEGYDPGYRSPFYPWVQGAGVLIPLWLITQMGGLTILFTFALTGVALWWYFYYAKGHMTREGAVLHLFERLGRQRDFGLERELREVLLESDRGGHDPFSELVAESLVIDLDEPTEYETIVWRVAARLTAEFGIPSDDVAEAILTESRVGLTPVANRVALPHVKLPNVRTFHLVLVRTPEDVRLSVEGGKGSEPVRALFFLVSPEARARRHLGFLASLAGRMDDDKFIFDWTSAETEQELKEAVLHEERFLSLEIREEGPTEELADREVREIALVEGALSRWSTGRGRSSSLAAEPGSSPETASRSSVSPTPSVSCGPDSPSGRSGACGSCVDPLSPRH
jgi:amino acid transporter/mannitol/fructose-specific phosphotransferase system IIA component (Ntr-type)